MPKFEKGQPGLAVLACALTAPLLSFATGDDGQITITCLGLIASDLAPIPNQASMITGYLKPKPPDDAGAGASSGDDPLPGGAGAAEGARSPFAAGLSAAKSTSPTNNAAHRASMATMATKATKPKEKGKAPSMLQQWSKSAPAPAPAARAEAHDLGINVADIDMDVLRALPPELRASIEQQMQIASQAEKARAAPPDTSGAHSSASGAPSARGNERAADGRGKRKRSTGTAHSGSGASSAGARASGAVLAASGRSSIAGFLRTGPSVLAADNPARAHGTSGSSMLTTNQSKKRQKSKKGRAPSMLQQWSKSAPAPAPAARAEAHDLGINVADIDMDVLRALPPELRASIEQQIKVQAGGGGGGGEGGGGVAVVPRKREDPLEE